MATLLEPTISTSAPAPPLPMCIMLNNVPLEHTTDDIYDALRNKAAIPSVFDVRVMSHMSSGKNYALASVSNIDNIPSSVQLQFGLPCSPVTVIFQELASAEFILNENLLSPEYERQILEEGYRLSVSVSFSPPMKISVTGPCSQVYKFRQYLTTLLSHTALQYTPHSIPTTSNIPVDGSHHNVPTDPIVEEIPLANDKMETEGGGGKSFTGLSRDVLLLMTRVGTFKGMVFHPDEGRAEVLASTEEEQDQCISKFQQSYQDITKNRQLKSGNLQVPSSFPPEELVSLFEEFNEKYRQCHFSHDETKNIIRIISMSSRQFDQAKKLISDKLESGGANPKGSSKQATPTHHGKIATKLGSSEVLQLSKFRKITVKRANIIEEEVDVIVNAANSQLNHGAGVAGALNKASNGELQRFSDAHTKRCGSVPVGGAVTTTAGGKLKCKHVIHTVDPIASQQKSEAYCSELTFLAITNSLLEAEKVKAVSISFPALSTGIFSVKKSLAADAIFQALIKYHYTSTKILKDIRIVILAEPTYSCFANHLVTLKLSQSDGSASKDDDRRETKSPTGATDGMKSNTGGNTGTTTGHTVSSSSTNNFLPPGFKTPLNIQYPALPSTFSTPTSNTTTNPLTITSTTTGRGRGLLHDPKFIYTSQGGNGRQLLQQVCDPTSTSSQEKKFNTPPSTLSAEGSSGGRTTESGCPICRNDKATDPVNTNCCQQTFCRSCLNLSLQYSCYCPICKIALRPVQGNQPPGTMDYRASSLSIPGYEGCGCITITYVIPSGTQGSEHPNPGAHYHGTHRTAYLPNNPEGQQVLGLLKKAFDAKLIFTIGTSHTTGAQNKVVWILWNDIHHKTTIRGEPYGYPDPTYLTRVKEELKAKGIQ